MKSVVFIDDSGAPRRSVIEGAARTLAAPTMVASAEAWRGEMSAIKLSGSAVRTAAKRAPVANRVSPRREASLSTPSTKTTVETTRMDMAAASPSPGPGKPAKTRDHCQSPLEQFIYKNTYTTKTNIPSKIDSLDSSPLILYD